jgi:hypothetical protein
MLTPVTPNLLFKAENTMRLFTTAVLLSCLGILFVCPVASAQTSIESRIALEPEFRPVVRRPLGVRERFDAFAFVDAVMAGASDSSYGFSSSRIGGVGIDGNRMEGLFHQETGQIFVHQTETFAQQREALPASGHVPSESDLLDNAKALLRGAGALTSETRFDSDILAAVDNDANGSNNAPRHLAYKVSAQHMFGGVPVYGDRLIFTYSLSGELISVAGRWRSVNPAFDARWASLDRSAVRSLAVRAVNDEVRAGGMTLLAGGIEVVRVFEVIDSGTGGFDIRLHALTRIPVAGPQGESRYRVINTDL